MIEFTGYLSGEAVKGFWRRSRKIGMSIVITTFVVFIPIIFSLAAAFASWGVLVGYGILCFVTFTFLLWPKSEKFMRQGMPKRIYTDIEYIVAETDTGEEFKLLSDVKQVFDHGEYYELVFPFGKVSDKFICQKSLLTQGTLEEFEALFSVEIIRVKK